MKTQKINLNELRVIIKEIINEATADEIKTKYYPDITQEIFNDIVNADKITSNLENGKIGNYAKWLLNLYKKNNLKLEDLYKAEEYLPIFDKLSKANKLEIKDINKYKSLSELYNVIADYVGNDKTISKQDEIRKEKSGGKKIYEDNRFLVIQPLTEEAACYYGKGTQWCTASTDGNNMFDSYNSNGPLYIIMDKTKRNKVGDYEKYQIHFESCQFMDSSDNVIDFDNHKELKELITKLIKHLNINENELVKKNYKCIMFIPNPSEEVQLEAVKQYSYAIQYIPNPSEEVQLVAVKQDGSAIKYIKKPHPSVLKYLEGNNNNINENTSLIRSIIKEVLNEYKLGELLRT